MNQAGSRKQNPLHTRRIVGTCLLLVLLAASTIAARAPSATDIIPVEQIRPGMKGQAKTIFAGREVESFDVEVLGVLRNFFGPRQDIILVRLLGPRVDFTGVVAGMSGSPVYLEGRLAGALSLRFGLFTKEPIAGVTPIADMFRAAENPVPPSLAEADLPLRYPLPADTAEALGLPSSASAYLVPIETPLTLSGFYPQTIARFADELSRYGFVAVPGGTASRSSDQLSPLEPGGAVSAALIMGDLNIAGTCTITLRRGDELYACGHPILAFGQVQLPMARAEVVTTVASQAASFKMANIGDLVGTFTQDRRTAVVGRLGPLPTMIPVELSLAGLQPGREQTFQFQLFQHPRLSPLLLGLTIFNGLVGSTEYGEEITYRIAGRIELTDHPAVQLEDMYSPGDSALPDAFVVANQVAQAFQQVFTNPFEQPSIERIHLRLEMIPERKSATIQNAWSDKSEVSPGETLTLKVVLQPYRGPRQIVTLPVQVPANTAKGDLRILVSEATLLNRLTRSSLVDPRFAASFGPRPTSLDQLIALLNRERRNDRLYVSLFQRNPTMLVQDKILPSVPLSQMNVLQDQSAMGQAGSTLVFYDSILNEASEPLDQVVSGYHWLQVRVR
ncbi:MAG: hypothetical protein HY653_07805 [Acidobacteria bacterium]|nr:hypothetical protein [Acidobacteriota bacterium]